MIFRRPFLSLLAVTLLLSLLPERRAFAQEIPTDAELPSGAVVCAPGVYLDAPDDCLPLGPSSYITEMSRLGLTFPPRALPVYKPDPALTQLPYFYFKLDNDIVPILSGPDNSSITGQSFQSGFVYVSYVDRVESNGVFYMLPNGGWIPGKGSRIGEYSRFQGLQFKSTPHNALAWALPFYTGSIPVYTAPGYNAPLTDKVLYPYVDIV